MTTSLFQIVTFIQHLLVHNPLAQTDGGAVLKLLPRNTICHSSRNGSSGATPRGEGKTAPKGDISRRCPAHRAWTARGTPNPGADPTHGASMRCFVGRLGRGLVSQASRRVDWALRGLGPCSRWDRSSHARHRNRAAAPAVIRVPLTAT